VNDLDGPTQEVPPFEKVGITTRLAVIGAVVRLTAVNEIFPLPPDPKPIVVLSFVQAYVVEPPELFVVKETVVELVLQTS
jgi:hypothetical protein